MGHGATGTGKKEYRMLSFNPEDPISEYVHEYTPKKIGRHRKSVPDWVVNARFAPHPSGGTWATTTKSDFPHYPPGPLRPKSKWAHKGMNVMPSRPSQALTESRAAFQAPPGHLLTSSPRGQTNVNKQRAWMRGKPTPYYFPDGDGPKSSYDDTYIHHVGHRPRDPIRQHKPNRLDAPFVARTLHQDSYGPINPSHVPERRRMRHEGPDIFANSIDRATMYRIMNREAGKADPFSVTGWGSKEVPPHPQPDETGRVKLVSGTAVSEEDKKQLERDLRIGMGKGVMGGTSEFYGDTTYRHYHSRPDLIATAMTWNTRATAWFDTCPFPAPQQLKAKARQLKT